MSGDYKWVKRYLRLAGQIATWSKDPSTKVGAVAVKENRILTSGYNGFPAGSDDSIKLYNDKETKYKRVVHAETNVVAFAAKHGISLDGATLFVTHKPCSSCFSICAQAGIKKIYYALEIEGWCEKSEQSDLLASELGVDVIHCPMK